jgi:hypothetical protein
MYDVLVLVLELEEILSARLRLKLGCMKYEISEAYPTTRGVLLE